MQTLILPNTYVETDDRPLIFLAGPIRSAPNWQDEAITYLFSRNEDLIIASPRRGVRDGIAPFVARGDDTYFSRQRAWERHYLKIAQSKKEKRGAIMFWLPGEEEHNCEKVYGAMTRLELGQAFSDYKHDNSNRFVIGSDGKFPEINTIAFDLRIDAPGKAMFNTLEATCDGALAYVKNQSW